MQTIKRTVADTDIDLDRDNLKYLSHMSWVGIMEEHNLFAVSSNSFCDSKNVYVDYEDRLSSRMPLQDVTPDFLADGQTLVEVFEMLDIWFYVYLQNDQYYVTRDNTTSTTIGPFGKYKLCTVNQYLVCFNDVNAQIYNPREDEPVWKLLVNQCEIPTIERWVGGVKTESDKNLFTDSYYKEYIWSDNSTPILPTDDYTNVTIETSYLNTTSEVVLAKSDSVEEYTSYRILRQIEIPISDPNMVSMVENVVAVASERSFYLSYDGGMSFTPLYYPAYEGWLGIASLSENGQYFFFAAESGVYRCNLGSQEWTYIGYNESVDDGDDDDGNDYNLSNQYTYRGLAKVWQFLSSNTFVFVIERTDSTGTLSYYVCSFGRSSSSQTLMGIDTTSYEPTDIAIHGYDDDGKYFGRVLIVTRDGLITLTADNILVDNVIAKFNYYYTFLDIPASGNFETTVKIESFSNSGGVLRYYHDPSHLPFTGLVTLLGKWFLNIGITPMFSSNDDSMAEEGWYTLSYKFFLNTPIVFMGEKYQTYTTGESEYLTPYSVGFTDGYTLFADDREYTLFHGAISSVSNVSRCEVNDSEILIIVGIEDENGEVAYTGYTNRLTDTDVLISFKFLYSSDEPYDEVPNLTYTGNELFLAFDNILRITMNSFDDDEDLLFNLAPINNQIFTENITGMLNISTTEVAIFFKNGITINTYTSDDTFGYRYEYYKSKVNIGLRRFDTVMNSSEGSTTLFPTSKGLATMNYQTYLATTDQVLEYLTDHISDRWHEFYFNSEYIDMIQWKSHIVLTNNTNIIWLYDSRYSAWWIFEFDHIVKHCIVKDEELYIISDSLGVLRDSNKYADRNTSGQCTKIDWYIVSQPLHFDAPTYYKNTKQFIFKFVQSKDVNNFKLQIKLYRKRLTVKDPEVFEFEVNELGTFIKRFNYWKINEAQYAIQSNDDLAAPGPLKLNGVTIKYEIGEEVR